jgi:hypothetical protein
MLRIDYSSLDEWCRPILERTTVRLFQIGEHGEFVCTCLKALSTSKESRESLQNYIRHQGLKKWGGIDPDTSKPFELDQFTEEDYESWFRQQDEFLNNCEQNVRFVWESSIVNTWTAIESMAFDLAREFLVRFEDGWNDKPASQRSIVGQKLDARDCMRLTRRGLVAKLLKAHQPGGFGLNQLDNLLTNSGIPRKTRRRKETVKTTIELHQFRNLIVHNGGRVDQHFLEVCEWLSGQYDVGDSLEGLEIIYSNSSLHSLQYCNCVIADLRKLCDLQPFEATKE